MNSICALKTYSCHMCDKTFGRRYSLNRHVENVHDKEDSTIDDQDYEHSKKYRRDHSCELINKTYTVEDSEQEESESEHSQDDGHDEDDDSDQDSETEEQGDDDDDGGGDDDDNDDDNNDDDDESSDKDESSSELEDNVAYQDWLEEAKESTRDKWSEKCEKYVSQGMNEAEAAEKANRKTLWAVKRLF